MIEARIECEPTQIATMNVRVIGIGVPFGDTEFAVFRKHQFQFLFSQTTVTEYLPNQWRLLVITRFVIDRQHFSYPVYLWFLFEIQRYSGTIQTAMKYRRFIESALCEWG